MKQIVSYRAWFWEKTFGIDIGSLSDVIYIKELAYRGSFTKINLRPISNWSLFLIYFLVFYTICTIPRDFLTICVANPVKIRFNQLRPLWKASGNRSWRSTFKRYRYTETSQQRKDSGNTEANTQEYAVTNCRVTYSSCSHDQWFTTNS